MACGLTDQLSMARAKHRTFYNRNLTVYSVQLHYTVYRVQYKLYSVQSLVSTAIAGPLASGSLILILRWPSDHLTKIHQNYVHWCAGYSLHSTLEIAPY